MASADSSKPRFQWESQLSKQKSAMTAPSPHIAQAGQVGNFGPVTAGFQHATADLDKHRLYSLAMAGVSYGARQIVSRFRPVGLRSRVLNVL